MIELVAFCAGVDRVRVAVDPCLGFCASVTAMTWDLAAGPVYSRGSGAVHAKVTISFDTVFRSENITIIKTPPRLLG